MQISKEETQGILSSAEDAKTSSFYLTSVHIQFLSLICPSENLGYNVPKHPSDGALFKRDAKATFCPNLRTAICQVVIPNLAEGTHFLPVLV